MRERRVSLLLLLAAVIVAFMSGVNTAKNELNFIFNGMISSSEGTDETNPLFDNGTPMASWNTLKVYPFSSPFHSKTCNPLLGRTVLPST